MRDEKVEQSIAVEVFIGGMLCSQLLQWVGVTGGFLPLVFVSLLTLITARCEQMICAKLGLTQEMENVRRRDQAQLEEEDEDGVKTQPCDEKALSIDDSSRKKLARVALFAAVEHGDAKKVDELLTQFEGLPLSRGKAPLINSIDYKGRAALHLAVELGHEGVADVLIARGIDVNARDGCALTALHIAAELGHEKIVARLIEKSPDLGYAQISGWTCVHLAILGRHVAVIKQLLATNLEWIRACDDRGRKLMTVLQLAIDYGLEDVFAALVESVKSSRFEKKVLEYALEAGSDSVVAKLLAQNPALIDDKFNYGVHALHVAAKHGRDDIVTRLLAQRPNFTEIMDDSRSSVLHYAVREGHDTTVALLLAHSPFLIDVVDREGENVLHNAARKGYDVIVARLLAERPALASQQNSTGRTALHLAAQDHHVKVVEQLLALKPELIDVEDQYSRTALHVALGCLAATTVEYLLEHGATLDARALWIGLTAARKTADDHIVEKMITRKPELVGSVCPANLKKDDEALAGMHVLHCVFGYRKCSPFCVECNRYCRWDDDGYCRNCSRNCNKSLFSEDLMRMVWQSSSSSSSSSLEEALRATHMSDDHYDKEMLTPFHVAVRCKNKFAIELVQWKLSLDEIIETYAKCEKPCPPHHLVAIRECLLKSLNKDVVGTVCGYLDTTTTTTTTIDAKN